MHATRAAAAAEAAGEGLATRIRRMVKPLGEAPFPTVVRALTGRRVVPFDAKRDAALLPRLRRSMAEAMRRARQEGIHARRPNEAGNAMEPCVERALRAEGPAADAPRTASGGRQAAGYPDLEIEGAGKVLAGQTIAE